MQLKDIYNERFQALLDEQDFGSLASMRDVRKSLPNMTKRLGPRQAEATRIFLNIVWPLDKRPVYRKLRKERRGTKGKN